MYLLSIFMAAVFNLAQPQGENLQVVNQLTIFSENQELFSVFIEGKKATQAPVQTFTSSELSGSHCSVMIIFENPDLQRIDVKKLQISGSGNKSDLPAHAHYRIDIKRGKPKLKLSKRDF